MNPPGIGQTSDAADFDIDDVRTPQRRATLRIVHRVNALVQTDRIPDFFPEKGVKVNIMLIQRLFDHQQMKTIPVRNQIKIGIAVGVVRVHHKADIRKFTADRLNVRRIETG